MATNGSKRARNGPMISANGHFQRLPGLGPSFCLQVDIGRNSRSVRSQLVVSGLSQINPENKLFVIQRVVIVLFSCYTLQLHSSDKLDDKIAECLNCNFTQHSLWKSESDHLRTPFEQ